LSQAILGQVPSHGFRRLGFERPVEQRVGQASDYAADGASSRPCARVSEDSAASAACRRADNRAGRSIRNRRGLVGLRPFRTRFRVRQAVINILRRSRGANVRQMGVGHEYRFLRSAAGQCQHSHTCRDFPSEPHKLNFVTIVRRVKALSDRS
jgi:hypothetical protein